MDPLMVTLRVLHIVFGVVLAGNIIFLAVLLEPKLRRLGPTFQGPVMRALMPVLTPIQIISFILVAGTGIIMAIITRPLYGGGLEVFWVTGWGLTILIATVVTAAGGVVGFGLTTPKGIRLGKLGQSIQGRPPTPEEGQQMQKLGDQIRVLSRVSMVIVLIVVILMSAARFV